jgi:hypothetical protein
MERWPEFVTDGETIGDAPREIVRRSGWEDVVFELDDHEPVAGGSDSDFSTAAMAPWKPIFE